MIAIQTAITEITLPRKIHFDHPNHQAIMFYEPGKTDHGLPHDPFKVHSTLPLPAIPPTH